MRSIGLALLAMVLAGCGSQQVAMHSTLEKQAMLIETVRAESSEISRSMRGVKTDLALLQERLDQQEERLASQVSREDIKRLFATIEERLAIVDQKQLQASSDIRKLTHHADDKGNSIQATREEIASLKRDVRQQMGNYKQALESVVSLVQSGSKTYRVKQGDSLAKVAKINQTTIERLKQLNHLDGDTIYPDQELIVASP